MEYSVFDAIGPNMIGPSSSHTAGALVIANIAGKLFTNPLEKVVFTLYGSFASTYRGHGTDKALVAGILGFHTEDTRIPNSFAIAQKRGIEFQFIENHEKNDLHPNTVKIEAIDQKGIKNSLVGESIGGGSVLIQRINEVEITLTGEYVTIIIKHEDVSGALASIAGIIGNHDLNIAFAKCYRERKGELAYTIIELDDQVTKAVIEKIKEQSFVYMATLIDVN